MIRQLALTQQILKPKNDEIKCIQIVSNRMYSSYQDENYRNRPQPQHTRNNRNTNNNRNKFQNNDNKVRNNDTIKLTPTRQHEHYPNNSRMNTRPDTLLRNRMNHRPDSNRSFERNNNPHQRNDTYNRAPRHNQSVNYNNDMESLRSIFLKSIEIEPQKAQDKKTNETPNKTNDTTTNVTEEKDDLTALLRSILLDTTTPNTTTSKQSIVQDNTKSSWRTKSSEQEVKKPTILQGQAMTTEKSKDKKPKTVRPKVTVKRTISIPNNAYWSIKQVGQELGIKTTKIHKTLLSLDNENYKQKTISEIRLDADTIELLVEELGHESIRMQPSSESIVANKNMEGPVRPPVICIMGHVDHGKTTLLDALRSKSNSNSKSVAAEEVGGITQIISAFQVNTITFLDTPGHAAFTSMRKSSKKAMDILILVIDCKEGIQAQTNEIIHLYLKDNTNQSLIVAMTKVDAIIDKDGDSHENDQVIAEYQYTIENQLASQGIDLADIQIIPISSKTGYGLDDLLDAIELQSQLMDLRSTPPSKEFVQMEGIILEGRMEKGLGVVVDVVVRDGHTLKVGSTVLCYASGVYGKVKRLIDVNGKSVKQALPSQPVRIIGLKAIPMSGETIITVLNEEKAKDILDLKMQEEEEEAAAKAKQNAAQITKTTEEVEEKEESIYPISIPIVLKADTHGSLSAIQDLIQNIYTTIKKSHQSHNHMFDIKLISSSIGSITSNDIQLANDSKAHIYAFGTPTYIKACTSGLSSYELNTCADNGVILHQHSIIYKVIDDLQTNIVNALPKSQTKVIHGSAIVQAIFNLNTKSNSNNVIAGLRILDGSFYKHVHPNSKLNVQYQIKRKGEEVVDGLSTVTLRKLKDDVESVKKNEECGINLGYKEYEKGDILECYSVEMKTMEIF